MQLQTEKQPMPIEWVKRLFQRLSAMYGQKFANQWAGLDMAAMEDVWADDLAGFCANEIIAGLEACKSRPFPPTLPEFMTLCRPGMDPVVAHSEAVLGMQERKRGNVGEWSHPAVYWAAVQIGSHDLLNQGLPAIRGRWEKALRESWAKGQWEPVPVPAVALPAPGKDVVSNAEAQRRVEQLAKDVASDNRTDHKEWARKIVANPKEHTTIAISMAREALGLDSEAA
jgi:hypothetical protein